MAEMEKQLHLLSRSDKMSRVLAEGFLAVEVNTLAQAAEVANYVAPEHLELLVKDSAAKVLTRSITTAGAIMLGNFTPTALGDFTAGPSHVLPTGRAGRFFSGLRVADFLRRTSIVGYSRGSVRKGDVRQLAAMSLLITQSTILSAQMVEPILDASALAVELAHSLNGYLKP